MRKVDCETIAQEILDEVKGKKTTKELVILTMGDNKASESYVKGKKRDCEYCGIPYRHVVVTSEAELQNDLMWNNSDDKVGGIIVQLPLPKGIDENRYTSQVRFDKDVDGFTKASVFKPCTPEGIVHLLKHELGDLTGKSVLIIGRGKLVGKPLAKMLLDEDCTVTVAHSKSERMNELLIWHDIIVTAVGKPNFLDLKSCRALMVVDAGVNRDENGKLCGDCYNFQDTGDGMLVTPIPKGVGLMTRAMLMKHMSEKG